MSLRLATGPNDLPRLGLLLHDARFYFDLVQDRVAGVHPDAVRHWRDRLAALRLVLDEEVARLGTLFDQPAAAGEGDDARHRAAE